jgi:dTDP-4-dehydrorhamnose 3,5-epimerase-like enzyme
MRSASELSFPVHTHNNGVLRVFESGLHVPFNVKRVFTVSAKKGDFRGDHAHKRCTQLLVCVAGRILVSCNNGLVASEHLLEDVGIGLLIPPGIWARQEYLVDGAVLMVLCDQGYEEAEYIRDFDGFKAYFGLMKSL